MNFGKNLKLPEDVPCIIGDGETANLVTALGDRFSFPYKELTKEKFQIIFQKYIFSKRI